MLIRPVSSEDYDDWLTQRCQLWPDGTRAEHDREIRQFFAKDFPRNPWTVLVAEDTDGRVVGFAELSIRPYAEGCHTSRVAYLEGWFVTAELRRSGVGKNLIAAAENWGRSRGCSEFASDCDPDNLVSAEAHRAMGFREAGTILCFKKEL